MTNVGLSGESIICFAGEDWWYHFPHSKNHIMKRLAGQNRVLFVNSLTLGLPSFSNPDLLMKIRRKARSYLRWLRKVPEGLWVFSPIILPFFGSKTARKLNRWLLILQLRLAMLLCRMRRPIVWVASLTAIDVIDSLDAKLILYQVSDKHDANEDSALSRDIIREMDRELRKSAAVVMYSGRKLYEEASHVRHRYFLEQAVDFDHFATEADDTAPDIACIPHPVLGYFGYMDYVMDLPLIAEVAKLRPEWHWVFIGTKSNLVQIAMPNVHFLGRKQYGELPRYLRHFDVCVLPWNQQNVFTSYGSAIKVREYLASGKPVVISPLYEYLNTPGIRIYRGPQEFISAVEDALHRDTPADRQLRQSAVKDSTWDVRTQQVSALIVTLLQQRAESRPPDARQNLKDR